MAKFTPRQRKHKINKREKRPTVVPQDTNVVELQPVSKTEKEEKRQKLKEELRAQQPKISGKKQKRLDKYIVRELAPMSLIHDLTSQYRRTSSRKKRTLPC